VLIDETANDASEWLEILQRHHVIRALNADDFDMSQQPCKACDLGPREDLPPD
jgi:hypothetical protein